LARFFSFLLFLAASANLMADETGYRLWLDTSTSGKMLTVVPHIAAPSAATLRYEIVSTKRGKSGRSSTSQSGRIAVDKEGTGTFAKLSLGVGPDDRYTIAVRVFDGTTMVAEQTLEYPR
jgi:hypothetical protein